MEPLTPEEQAKLNRIIAQIIIQANNLGFDAGVATEPRQTG
jgi:hypothetical protein